MSLFFLFVPVSPTSFAVNLILGVFVWFFFVFSWHFVVGSLFVRSYFTKSLSRVLSVGRGFSSSSNSLSIIYTKIWYYLGKFNRMWVIIYESSICTSIFCRSPLSSSILVINSSGFLVTSSILHLANFLHCFVLKFPVVGSIFLEMFVLYSLTSPYSLSLDLLIQQSESRLYFLVQVSDNYRL